MPASFPHFPLFSYLLAPLVISVATLCVVALVRVLRPEDEVYFRFWLVFEAQIKRKRPTETM